MHGSCRGCLHNDRWRIRIGIRIDRGRISIPYAPRDPPPAEPPGVPPMPPRTLAPDMQIVLIKALALPVPDRLCLGQNRQDHPDAS